MCWKSFPLNVHLKKRDYSHLSSYLFPTNPSALAQLLNPFECLRFHLHQSMMDYIEKENQTQFSHIKTIFYQTADHPAIKILILTGIRVSMDVEFRITLASIWLLNYWVSTLNHYNLFWQRNKESQSNIDARSVRGKCRYCWTDRGVCVSTVG